MRLPAPPHSPPCPPRPGSDLAITKVVSSPVVELGTPFAYTIRVTNQSPNNVTANNVTVTDTIPASLVIQTPLPAGARAARRAT